MICTYTLTFVLHNPQTTLETIHAFSYNPCCFYHTIFRLL